MREEPCLPSFFVAAQPLWVLYFQEKDIFFVNSDAQTNLQLHSLKIHIKPSLVRPARSLE